MMKKWTGAVAALSIASAALALDVEFSRKADADFASYRTYAWAERPKLHPEHPLVEGSPLDLEIKQAAERVLAKRGLERVARGKSDLEVRYQGFAKDVTTVEGVRRKAGPVTWVGVPDVHSVRSHQEGTLVIEVLDVERQEIVWSGWATGVAESTRKLQAKAATAVRRILRHYPSP